MNASNQEFVKVKKYPDYIKLDPDDPCFNNLKPIYIGQRDGNHRCLNTNVDFHKPQPVEKQVEIVDPKRTTGKKESVPEVSSGGLKLPPKKPDQFATEIDMSKDEWTLGEILDLRITAIPFLVEKLIPLHTLNVLAGQSERGKSTLYTQLSLAIIRGDKEFLGCKLKTKYKRVLVISTEDGPVALSFRTNKQLKQTALSVEFRNRLTFITNQDNLDVRIENYLNKTRVDLIVMDAFADVFTGGDLNASNSVRRYLNTYVKLIQKYGCTVLFVHHVGKGKQGNRAEKDQLLGSTGIEGKMRNVLMLSIVNEQHQLSIAKGNYVNRDDRKIPMYLDFDTNTLTFSRADGPAKPTETVEGEDTPRGGNGAKRKPGRQKDMALYDHAIKLYKEGKPQKEIAEIVGRDKSTICKWIKEDKSKPDLQ
jgi:hypothetical protein